MPEKSLCQPGEIPLLGWHALICSGVGTSWHQRSFRKTGDRARVRVAACASLTHLSPAERADCGLSRSGPGELLHTPVACDEGKRSMGRCVRAKRCETRRISTSNACAGSLVETIAQGSPSWRHELESISNFNRPARLEQDGGWNPSGIDRVCRQRGTAAELERACHRLDP